MHCTVREAYSSDVACTEVDPNVRSLHPHKLPKSSGNSHEAFHVDVYVDGFLLTCSDVIPAQLVDANAVSAHESNLVATVTVGVGSYLESAAVTSGHVLGGHSPCMRDRLWTVESWHLLIFPALRGFPPCIRVRNA